MIDINDKALNEKPCPQCGLTMDRVATAIPFLTVEHFNMIPVYVAKFACFNHGDEPFLFWEQIRNKTK